VQDIDANHVASNSVTTERQDITNGSAWTHRPASAYAASGSGTYPDHYSGGIQAAWDDAYQSLASGAAKTILVDGVFDDSLAVGSDADETGLRLDGGIWQSQIFGPEADDAPVVDIANANTQLDIFLKNLTLNNQNTEDYPAVKCNADEIVVENVSVKTASGSTGNGMEFDGSEDVWIYNSDCQSIGGDWALMFTGGDKIFVTGYEAIGSGYKIDGATGVNMNGLYTLNAPTHGIHITGDNGGGQLVTGSFISATSDGVFISGSDTNRNLVTAFSVANGQYGVRFGQTDQSTVFGVSNVNSTEDVYFDTAATNCTYIGWAGSAKLAGSNDALIGQFDSVTYGLNATDPNVVPWNGWPSVTDIGATRPRWKGVIGGGPLGGVDLSTTTGQFVGDRAISNGADASSATGALARWDGSNWQYHNPNGTV
jgi:hypothetical protein